MRLSAVRTPVTGLTPEAVLQSAMTVARSSKASEKSAPVISAPLKKAETRLALEKLTFRREAFWNLV